MLLAAVAGTAGLGALMSAEPALAADTLDGVMVDLAGIRQNQALGADATGTVVGRGRVELALTDGAFGGGTSCTGGTCYQAVLQAAVDASSTSGRTVVIPAGTWLLSTAVILKPGAVLIFDPGAQLKALAVSDGGTWGGSSAAAMLQGVQGNPAANVKIINGDLDVNGQPCNGIQIAGKANAVVLDHVTVRNAGRGGIALQRHVTDATARPADPVVNAPRILSTGATNPDGTVSAGVRFYGCDRPVLHDAYVVGCKGFGALFDASPDWTVWGGRFEQAISDTGFEAIGATPTSTGGLVVGASIYGSKDNGISLSADRCIAIGNRIDGAENHGIYLGGSNAIALANVIKDVGRNTIQVDPGAEYGAFRLNGDGTGCLVASTSSGKARTPGTARRTSSRITSTVLIAVGEGTSRRSTPSSRSTEGR